MKKSKAMVQVDELNDADCRSLLLRVGYGHLGLAHGAHPYVVPVHYVYDEPIIYFFTTDGKKTGIIEANPNVCLQVEELRDEKNWQSVIVLGEAILLSDRGEIDSVMGMILAANPDLTPALSLRWMDQWVRANIQLVYKIIPNQITGRATV